MIKKVQSVKMYVYTNLKGFGAFEFKEFLYEIKKLSDFVNLNMISLIIRLSVS